MWADSCSISGHGLPAKWAPAGGGAPDPDGAEVIPARPLTDTLPVMAESASQPRDNYPSVHIEDTDAELPEHVVNTSLRYTGYRTVAKGGKCLIQSAKDHYLGRLVAVKSLRKELADDEVEQTRFLREARVSAMLQHPNTIPVYDISRDNRGHLFFTMKLVEGQTLREVIDLCRESEFYYIEGYGLDRFVSILIQVGNALDYAHTHGVIHRDIKPANVLMGPYGEVTLLDWGLAKVWSTEDERTPSHDASLLDDDPSLTGSGQLDGTVLYMSPEQIDKRKDIDGRTDVYSLGVVLYEALTLEPMLSGDSFQEICDKARHTVPPLPSQVAPDRGIPADLEELCMQAVAKKREDRFESMHKFVTELRAWRARRVRRT